MDLEEESKDKVIRKYGPDKPGVAAIGFAAVSRLMRVPQGRILSIARVAAYAQSGLECFG